MKKKAIVSGVFGQDAYYLIKLLLSLDYEVWGTYRYSSSPLKERSVGYPEDGNIKYVCLDITDPSGINTLVRQIMPDEIYNLAAISHVGESFKNPSAAFNVNCGAVINWLEAIRHISPKTKFYQASTSELFGSNYTEAAGSRWQDEFTPLSPNSPYGAAKLAAHNMVRIYRESYGLFACAGILHNHGSERRGENFVTRKITKWLGTFISWKSDMKNIQSDVLFECVADNIIAWDIQGQTREEQKILGEFPKLRLGNVNAIRDWSHAEDMVRGMHMMLQQEMAKEFVLCSGKGHSVQHFIEVAFNVVGIKNPEYYWVVDPEFYRPCDVEYLCGSCEKASNVMGWNTKIEFNELVERMVNADVVRS